MKGLLITFEGGDGAGKSTLLHSMQEHLLAKGEPVLVTRAPGGTAFGQKLRSLLLHEKEPLNSKSELFLFLSDRAQHMQEVILPAISEGKIVLCDRFSDSTVAYQGVARGLDPSWVRKLCLFATGNVEPDLTYYLDIDPEIGMQRAHNRSGAKDRMEREDLSFHAAIRASFLQMASEEPNRIAKLDATLSPEILLKQAVDIFYDLFQPHR